MAPSTITVTVTAVPKGMRGLYSRKRRIRAKAYNRWLNAGCPLTLATWSM
jgi:hypothetical protein